MFEQARQKKRKKKKWNQPLIWTLEKEGKIEKKSNPMCCCYWKWFTCNSRSSLLQVEKGSLSTDSYNLLSICSILLLRIFVILKLPFPLDLTNGHSELFFDCCKCVIQIVTFDELLSTIKTFLSLFQCQTIFIRKYFYGQKFIFKMQ